MPLKGKILNVERARFDKMLAFEEIRTLITALGCGIGTEDFDIEKLRYHKVVIMTDADVDGSHIRTLLLTFFFRQMPQLIERGYLYIAQPPLYRMKRGKSEFYLHDDKAFESFIVNAGSDSLTLEGSGGHLQLRGQELESFLKEVGEAQRTLDSFALNGLDPDVVRALATFGDITKESFSSPASVERLATRLSEQLYIEVPTLFRPGGAAGGGVSVQSREDKEQGAYILTVTLLGEDKRSTTQIAPTVVGSDDFRRLQQLFSKVRSLGEAPFTLVSDGGGKEKRRDELTSIFGVRNTVIERGRQGLTITRFKGLGEMNPEQLWETTLNPKHRSLLQVRIDDLVEADGVFNLLMGDSVEPRREFIEENALRVRNLDI